MKRTIGIIMVSVLCFGVLLNAGGCIHIKDPDVGQTAADGTIPVSGEDGAVFDNMSYWVRTEDKKVNIMPAAIGGTEPYLCSVSFKRTTNNKWHNLTKDYEKKTSVYLDAQEGTDYQSIVTVRDSEGRECGKILEIPGDAEPVVNNSELASSSIKAGKSINVTAKGKWGREPYTYCYYYKRAGGKVWNSFGEEYTAEASASFRPREKDSYSVKVVIIDSDNQGSEKILEAEVK